MSAPADPSATASAATTASPSATAATVPGQSPRVVYERPPPGLARGTWSVPAWVVVVLGLALVAGIVAFFVIRHRRDKAPDSSLVPPSIPPSSRR